MAKRFELDKDKLIDLTGASHWWSDWK
jgi:hypothetical protein